MNRRRGWTLLELIVVLALVLLVLAPALLRSGSSDARRAAVAVQGFLLSARIEAVRRDLPVAVVYRSDRRSFEQRLGDDPSALGDPCSGTALTRLDLDRFGRTALLRSLRDDLVWLPTGVGRTCSGAGVIAGTLEFGRRSPEQRLVISSAGRIRREAVP